MATEALIDLEKFLASEWDPDLTVGEWWEKLGVEGWSAPDWDPAWYGRGLSRSDGTSVALAIKRHRALPAPGGLGLMLAGPTIAAHGTDDQKRSYLRDIVTGQRSWCQLFSEPGAGSDLAGVSCSAVLDGDEWCINGQKVWTSAAQVCDMGMLLARTNPDVPKHQGLSWFAFEMRQPGVVVRALREMTGRSVFNEVFLDDAVAPVGALLGGRDRGWTVATTTLMNERAGLTAGGHSAGSLASAGQLAGDLARRAGDFTVSPKCRTGDALAYINDAAARVTELAVRMGRAEDPLVRQQLAHLYTLVNLGRYNGLRAKAGGSKAVPGHGNIDKLTMSDIGRRCRDLSLSLLGPTGTLYPYNKEQSIALAEQVGDFALVGETALFASAVSIFGGTDEIQRNILSERVLGLPKDPHDVKAVPFRDLPRNG
jgi:alkylation response protein AidB-like acyl-CoA dehydrogenase